MECKQTKYHILSGRDYHVAQVIPDRLQATVGNKLLKVWNKEPYGLHRTEEVRKYKKRNEENRNEYTWIM